LGAVVALLVMWRVSNAMGVVVGAWSLVSQESTVTTMWGRDVAVDECSGRRL
jgi:hypothetical protein